MVSEEELRKLSMEIEKLKQALMYLESQGEELQKALASLEETKNSIKALEGSMDKELYVDIGEGIFMKVKPVSDKLLVRLEDRVIVEKSPEETIEEIEKGIANLKDAIQEIEKKKQELMAKYNETMKKVEELYRQSMSSGGV